MSFSIATWNVNSLKIRLPQVLDWLAANPVDALCLQELKLADEAFPIDAIAAAGYQVEFFGQKTYNGVAIISKRPLRDVVRNNPYFPDEQIRLISATLDTPLGAVRIINGYFPNGQDIESDKFVYKMGWLHGLRTMVAQELKTAEHLVLLGDYNIAPTDADVHDPAGWRDKLHCSVPERLHFQALLDLGLSDAYRHLNPSNLASKTYSWWDYRMQGFARNKGLRIDHILCSAGLAQHLQSCHIDVAPRKLEQPSDHTPVVAVFS